ncbi:MAG: selenide, water dikinase SelD [Leptolyngbya sp. DLM2.Bin15]|nr:MAG: selenide, water dikinase SelD [Leptolyngbya sp. DLM2.Bin15]
MAFDRKTAGISVQNLLLIGGGHSHAIALRQLGMHPIPGVRLTLVTDVWHTPYSGMLPGYVAGYYKFDQCHIDLLPLAKFANARLISDRAIGLDLDRQQIHCANHPPISFDRLSMNLGSTPATTVPGAADHAIPAKPISQFLHHWHAILDQVRQRPEQPLSLAIVGGGAGGVELALSIHTHLSRLYREAGQVPQVQVHLVHRGPEILEGRDRWVRQQMLQILKQRGIQVHLGVTVNQVLPGRLIGSGSFELDCDRILWVTQASAAPWLAQSGLATDERGFLQVNAYLQSVSHPQVFAAGDMATQINHPRPKAGVFAVRQGQPLVNNLRRSLLGKSLQPYYPQQEFLILIGTGDGQAVASRGRWGLGPYRWLWRWKDHIDRTFMEQFAQLPVASMERSVGRSVGQPMGRSLDAAIDKDAMRCLGCGAKVGGATLGRSLARLHQTYSLTNPETVQVGLGADDAAVIQIPADRLLVQTVDYLPALVDDPFLAGQITAHHCLNDLWAMGATPQSALAIATLPPLPPQHQEETLYHLLAGVVTVLNAAQASLIGGHTSEGDRLALGLTCNGLAARQDLWCHQGLRPGQALILTKALGTGLLFAADMRRQAKGRWIEGAIASMLQSNQGAIAVLRHHGVTACTDVSGFGLAGHLLNLVQASHVAVELQLHTLPRLLGVDDLLPTQIRSSLDAQNSWAALPHLQVQEPASAHLMPLLFDPQTSGGLLAAVPDQQAIACVDALQTMGYASRCIGRVLPRSEQPPITVRP